MGWLHILDVGLGKVTPVGFEPTHPKIVELESTALDHSAKVSMVARILCASPIRQSRYTFMSQLHISNIKLFSPFLAQS